MHETTLPRINFVNNMSEYDEYYQRKSISFKLSYFNLLFIDYSIIFTETSNLRFERKYKETVTKTRKFNIRNQYSNKFKRIMMMNNSDQRTVIIAALDRSSNEVVCYLRTLFSLIQIVENIENLDVKNNWSLWNIQQISKWID